VNISSNCKESTRDY